MFVSVEPCLSRRSKESRLPSLLSYSVVKEPASPKGRLDCQTPSSVSSGMFPMPCGVNPFRLTRDTSTAWMMRLERSNCRGTTTAGTADSRARSRPCQLRRAGNWDNCDPANRIPTIIRLIHTPASTLRACELRLVFQRSEYRVGTMLNESPPGAIPTIFER